MIRSTLVLTVLAGCAPAAEPGSSSNEPPMGQLRLMLHDKPTADVDEVWVAWDEVAVHSSADGWVTVSEVEASVDLLTLTDGIATELGLITLPAGDYQQIRLHLTDSWVVVDGETEPLDVPSGTTSGVKLNRGFTVPECGELVLSIDWDVDAHLIANPQGYKLRPTLRVSDESVIERCPQPPLTEADADYCLETVFAQTHGDNRMSFVGDSNGDGLPEFVLASYAESATRGLVAWYESPHESCAVGSTADMLITGSSTGFRMGTAIVGSPDVDTFVVSDRNDNANGGYVWAVRDFPGGTLPSSALTSPTARVTGSSRLGTSLALGDFDGDGSADTFMGAQPTLGGVGRIFLGLPTTSTSEAAADLILRTPPRTSENSLEAAFSDLNGDGLDELVVAPRRVGSSVRELWIVNGSSSLTGTRDWSALLDGTRGVKITGLPDWVWFVADAGDVDADGYEDLLVGSNEQVLLVYGEALSGSATVAFSDLDSATFERDVTVPGSGLGRTISGLGDLDGDGIDDFGFASPSTGEVFVVRGSTTRFSGTLDVADIGDGHPISGLKLESVVPGFGAGLRSADADGDGQPDLAVGGYFDVLMFADPL